VRELRNALERASAISERPRILAEDIAGWLPAARAAPAPPPAAAVRPLAAMVAELERTAIAEALAAARGNKVAAARMLGVSRAKLYDKMTRLDIPV
jgi:DNA-binding NtrC family response regulator